jgi:PAS domain S-box-containing protein
MGSAAARKGGSESRHDLVFDATMTDDEWSMKAHPRGMFTVDHAIVATDKNGHITHWDDGAEEFFGYAATEAIGRPVDLIVPEEMRERHWEGFHRVMAGGERHLEGAAINLPVRVRSGEVLAFPARFAQADGPHGEPVGAMAVFARRTAHEQPWTPIEQ